MPVKVQKQGDYELFETTQHHKILALGGKQWFAAVKGQQGDILVHSDRDHKRDRTLQQGHYYIAEFHDDPKFKDMPHLFLEKDGKYQELVIPNGLPTGRDTQKRVVWTDDTLSKDELEQYLKHPAPAGAGEERMDRPGGGSAANVTHYLKGIDLPAKPDALIDYAKRQDAPKAVIDQLRKLDQGAFRTMADITKALAGEQNDARLPISNYDNLTVDEVNDHLDDLSGAQLEKVRRYEEQHKGRKTVLEAVARKQH